MVQVFITNNLHGTVDRVLEDILSQDAKARVEKMRENNFTIDTIEIILSFYAPPLVKILDLDIQDRSVFNHRQKVRLGFHIVHPMTYQPYFYHFIIEEASVSSE